MYWFFWGVGGRSQSILFNGLCFCDSAGGGRGKARLFISDAHPGQDTKCPPSRDPAHTPKREASGMTMKMRG
jgi:hypothetical protein